MFKNGQRLDVKLAQQVPVFWVYVTAWAVSDGVVNFRNDIYGLDGLEQFATAEGEPAPLDAGGRGTGATRQGQLSAGGTVRLKFSTARSVDGVAPNVACRAGGRGSWTSRLCSSLAACSRSPPVPPVRA